jgi:hypothetical protein
VFSPVPHLHRDRADECAFTHQTQYRGLWFANVTAR